MPSGGKPREEVDAKDDRSAPDPWRFVANGKTGTARDWEGGMRVVMAAVFFRAESGG